MTATIARGLACRMCYGNSPTVARSGIQINWWISHRYDCSLPFGWRRANPVGIRWGASICVRYLPILRHLHGRRLWRRAESWKGWGGCALSVISGSMKKRMCDCRLSNCPFLRFLFSGSARPLDGTVRLDLAYGCAHRQPKRPQHGARELRAAAYPDRIS